MRDNRGNLSIEFAILFPLFLLLAIGMFDIGMLIIERMQVGQSDRVLNQRLAGAFLANRTRASQRTFRGIGKPRMPL
jgi:hypothetical protein